MTISEKKGGFSSSEAHPTSALIEIGRISEALGNQARFRCREDATKKKLEKKWILRYFFEIFQSHDAKGIRPVGVGGLDPPGRIGRAAVEVFLLMADGGLRRAAAVEVTVVFSDTTRTDGDHVEASTAIWRLNTNPPFASVAGTPNAQSPSPSQARFPPRISRRPRTRPA